MALVSAPAHRAEPCACGRLTSWISGLPGVASCIVRGRARLTGCRLKFSTGSRSALRRSKEDHHLSALHLVMATKASGTVRPFVRIAPGDLLLYQALVDALAA